MEKVRFTLAKNSDDIFAFLEKVIEEPSDITILAAAPKTIHARWKADMDEKRDHKNEFLADERDMTLTCELSLLTQRELFTRPSVSMARYYVVKPVRYEDLLQYIARPENKRGDTAMATNDPIADVLLAVGIPANLQGYQFIHRAVTMVIQEPTIINRVTRALYPGVAEHFDTTATKVERSIRHAIEVVWKRGNVDVLNDAYGFTVCSKEDKQTNSEFIALVANICKDRR